MTHIFSHNCFSESAKLIIITIPLNQRQDKTTTHSGCGSPIQ